MAHWRVHVLKRTAATGLSQLLPCGIRPWFAMLSWVFRRRQKSGFSFLFYLPPFFPFFLHTGVWTQDLMLSRQAFYWLSHASSPRKSEFLMGNFPIQY
jgi:hypothetical protein